MGRYEDILWYSLRMDTDGGKPLDTPAAMACANKLLLSGSKFRFEAVI